MAGRIVVGIDGTQIGQRLRREVGVGLRCRLCGQELLRAVGCVICSPEMEGDRDHIGAQKMVVRQAAGHGRRKVLARTLGERTDDEESVAFPNLPGQLGSGAIPKGRYRCPVAPASIEGHEGVPAQ